MSGHWWDAAGGPVADLLSAVAAAPGDVILRWRDEELTGNDLIGSVAGAYRAMGAHGVGPGSVVAVLVEPNRPDMLIARYAATLLGAAVCYVRTTSPGSSAAVLPIADQSRILAETGASVVYADAENHRRATDLAAAAGTPVTVVAAVRGATGPTPAGAVEPWDPDRTVLIGYTSGSTGRPKGILVPGRAWAGLVGTTRAAVTDRIRMLVNTPVSHTVGTMVDAALTSGATVLLREEFRPDRFRADVAEHRITRTFLATAHLYQLIDHLEAIGRPEPAAAGLATLRLIIYSGSAAAPARIARAVRLLGPILAQGYGTSETGGITVLDPGEHYDPWLSTTVGRPFPEVQVGLRDTETGAEVALGDVGQVWIRTPYAMSGYLNDPELTARVLRDGWYATGDLGYRDDKGYLHLLGRTADVVKVQYVKVHPTVVETEILALDGVRDAAVYGVRDEDLVESLQCAVVLDPGTALTTDDIRSRIAAALSPAHVPQNIAVLDELPLNGTGKPDKVLLRSRHARPAAVVD